MQLVTSYFENRVTARFVSCIVDSLFLPTRESQFYALVAAIAIAANRSVSTLRPNRATTLPYYSLA
jgi:hypothetical protein